MVTTYVVWVRWTRGTAAASDREVDIRSFQGDPGEYQDGEVARTTSYSEARSTQEEFRAKSKAAVKRIQAEMRLVCQIMES